MIAAALGHQLAVGAIAPGDLSRSGLLAQRFRVSRIVVRAAVRHLEDERVVAHTPSGYELVAAGSEVSPQAVPGVDRVEHFVLRDIEAGRYKPGDRVPTGAELGRRLGVSSSTANNALRRLKHKGVLHGGPGRAGTYVAVPGEKRPPTAAQQAEQLATAIRQQIKDGTCPPGTPLPSNRELAATHQVPPHIVIEAVSILVADKLVETLGSVGKIVRDPAAADEPQMMTKCDQLVAAIRRDVLNRTLAPGDTLPSTTKLAHRYGMAQTTVSKSLPKLQFEGLIERTRRSEPARNSATPPTDHTSPQGMFRIAAPDAWRHPPTIVPTDRDTP